MRFCADFIQRFGFPTIWDKTKMSVYGFFFWFLVWFGQRKTYDEKCVSKKAKGHRRELATSQCFLFQTKKWDVIGSEQRASRSRRSIISCFKATHDSKRQSHCVYTDRKSSDWSPRCARRSASNLGEDFFRGFLIRSQK